MYSKDDEIRMLREHVKELENSVVERGHRVKELKGGACRFNCRTAKSAFLAGFDAGAEDTVDGGRIIDDDFYKEVTEEAYKKFCE